MKSPWFDPISERWIKPRPEKEEQPVEVSMGEALLNATAAQAERERCDRIWKITRQVAEGCNDVPVVEAECGVVQNAGGAVADAGSENIWVTTCEDDGSITIEVASALIAVDDLGIFNPAKRIYWSKTWRARE